MEDETCRGCGAKVCENGCETSTNWSIPCGCSFHGDHGGCGKRCELGGCLHPRHIVLSGTLEESEKYADDTPPAYLVLRAVEEEHGRLEKKYRRKLRRLETIREDFS